MIGFPFSIFVTIRMAHCGTASGRCARPPRGENHSPHGTRWQRWQRWPSHPPPGATPVTRCLRAPNTESPPCWPPGRSRNLKLRSTRANSCQCRDADRRDQLWILDAHVNFLVRLRRRRAGRCQGPASHSSNNLITAIWEGVTSGPDTTVLFGQVRRTPQCGQVRAVSAGTDVNTLADPVNRCIFRSTVAPCTLAALEQAAQRRG
jgi:hypothetical protein